MPRFRPFTVLLVTLFVLGSTAACSMQQGVKDGGAEREREAQQSRAADEAAIRAASTAWSQAAQAKDLDKAVSFYADDAIEFVDKGPLAKGKENIRESWKKLLALPGPGLSFAPTAIAIAKSGDMAYEYGLYDIITTDKNGKTNDEKGKYVTVWKKQADGSWKVAIDIDNPGQ
ncbi:MAG TPA: SgcJ/EcaC family oxidoreductase [Candidatus Sulfotelmatobacter sp.]|jgi:uncharacterized protein (TIGR02246 family)|nr:SgcJ/EcaC family oxidoreductase [Candidatus Sulfotelmatobacter sp.]